jgi:hypothetical protein
MRQQWVAANTEAACMMMPHHAYVCNALYVLPDIKQSPDCYVLSTHHNLFLTTAAACVPGADLQGMFVTTLVIITGCAAVVMAYATFVILRVRGGTAWYMRQLPRCNKQCASSPQHHPGLKARSRMQMQSRCWHPA